MLESNDGAAHWASSYGCTDCVRELIARGADVNAANNFGRTPLMETSFCCRVDSVRLLLAAGAGKRRVDVVGRTAHLGGWRVLS